MSRIPPPPFGATLDDDEEPANIPPPPEGATLDQRQGRPAPDIANAPRLPSLGMDSVVSARDGDTLRTSSGASIRLPGVDAPELKQQGWDRRGLPVPIGQQSQQWISDAIKRATASIGQPVGHSYGRTVAPVTIEGQDLGQTAARFGQALAAPRYLPDPQQRFQTMQAERLARQNGLGVHDTMFQPPEQYRRAPMAAPSRETVAQFWDTPTPMAGLRPEDEQAFLGMANDLKVPVEQVVQYARDHGFTVDPANVEKSRAAVAKSGIPAAAEYRDRIKPLTDLGDGALGAGVRGFGSGALAGGLDEVGAFADTMGLTPGRESVWNSDRRIADVWANNRDQNAAILGYDDFAHPWATTTGEVAGGLVVPFGARAKTVPELFRVGAAYGGAGGFLGTEGDIGQRAIGAAVGVPVGGALGAGAGKALEGAIAAVARARAMRGSYRAPEASGAPVEPVRDELGEDVIIGSQSRPGSTAGYVSPQPEADMPSASRQAMAVDPGASISAEPRQRAYIDLSRPIRMDQPLSEAQVRAMTDRIDPRDVVPIPSNEVGSVEEAAAINLGRYVEAKPPNERAELTRQTVRGINGPVPKIGPVDLVGWLRLSGGLRDSGGELAHMGLTNAARKMDFAGQEARFGPLVNPDGMTFDDAAQAAFEAGYFPELTERPDINTFLDAMRGTHEGWSRRFLPEDQPELERFYGAQRDRYDIEQQRYETGQPVWHDNSVPASEPQPFPPVQAYEEWPAGGPDFAGNIDLRKLESPQDISRALSTTEKRVGFDAATRGRIAHAETERLAADLNMTPETLLSRRRGGAFNAEEALAARQLLAKSGNELVNMARRIQGMETPGDDALAEFQEAMVRHVAIQEQVAGMTAEAGRALQQFRQTADSRAVRRDVLAGIIASGGGRKRLVNAAEAILDATEAEPGKFNTLIEKMAQPRWQDKAIELMYVFKLSRPSTHVVNVTSNLLTSLAQVPEYAAGAAIGKVRQMVPGANVDRVIGSEVGARAFGLVQGFRDGLPEMVRAFKTGESSDVITRLEMNREHALPGKTGHVLRTPLRALMAEDELFKAMARRMEINGEAVRIAHREGLKGEEAKARVADLVANPTDAMLERAMEYGRYLTFQTQLGDIGRGIQQAKQNSVAMTGLFPFIRTPINLVKFAAERSPAAPLLEHWRADFKAGGARRDVAIARALVGTAAAATIYEAAQAGHITGSRPLDPVKGQFMQADGWQPYSFKIGDKFYSFARLDPFATTLGVAADLATKAQGMTERQLDDHAMNLTASIISNLTDKVWLSSASDLLQAVNDWPRYGPGFVRNFVAGTVVPAASTGIKQSVDPVARDQRSIGDAIQSRIPGLSDNLPAKRDIWGRPIVNEGGIGPDIMSPMWTSTAKNDSVNAEMLRIGARFQPPDRYITKDGKRVDLTPQQFERYSAQAGQDTYARIQALMADPKWKGMAAVARAKAASDAARDAKKGARDSLFGSTKGAPRKGSIPPPPPGAVIDGDAGGINVFADLQKAIPGIRFTSGFRTPEYQAEMRKRGYHPADNSGHLDGASLDMLAPPGKSLGWLAQQVKRAYPNARLLPEGDHLHGTFPGYWGAPVLGGAKGAGLRNPLIGMPPPPPGATLDR